jgi:predicted small lipoprotein YifL
MTRLLAALLALAAVVQLTACGRAGPPRVPGPKEQVIYPRAYPQYPPQGASQGTFQGTPARN